MTYDEALSKAVLGFKVRRIDWPDNHYVYYAFDGWCITKGNSSGPWYGKNKSGEWIVIDDKVEPWPAFAQTNWNVDAAVDEQVEETPVYINKDAEAWLSLNR